MPDTVTPQPNDPNRVVDADSPVREIKGVEEVKEEIGLCLSGGGYRAMVFHIGVLWRLNQAGWLPRLDRISSVSGGSITSAVLGMRWNELAFDIRGVAQRFGEVVVAPLRGLAGQTIDKPSILGGIFGFGTISEKVAKAYDKHLYQGATLQALPDAPRFVINATSVQSGALWRFSKPYMADYRVGRVNNPQVRLADAVAASSAFPPVLSPSALKMKPGAVKSMPGTDLDQAPYTTDAVLTDGGVYDNMGLETVWKNHKTVLVSDAGGKMQPEPEPHEDWARHFIRIIDIVDNQVRSLRKQQVIAAYLQGKRKGAYWGIRSNVEDFKLADALPCPFSRTLALANTETRLKEMPGELQERLINWGYAVCDTALRKHVDLAIPKGEFPYPRGV